MITDPVPFLANIALVAYADGVLSGNELAQLESIRQELKLKKSDYNAAKKIVEGGDYTTVPVGTFADQVKNLELMLRVGFADDDLGKKETAIILGFCKTIGITQDQLTRLRSEVVATLKQQSKVCMSCGAEHEGDVSFCPKCGADMRSSEQEIQVKAEIPNTGIAIEFAESTAASFGKALELAKTMPGYQSIMKGKKTWHLAVFPSGQIADALPLADCLSGLKNKTLFIDGKENQWEDVFGFVNCASQRASAYRPVDYCFGKESNSLNLWGCKQAKMDWTEWSKWFCYGRWERVGRRGEILQWRFDKERIRHDLATKLFRYRSCPHMTQLAEATLRNFPEVVIPATDPNWTYRQQGEESPGAVKIVEKHVEDGYAYTNEFWVEGVKPKGLAVYTEIMIKAFRDLGYQPQTVHALVKQ